MGRKSCLRTNSVVTRIPRARTVARGYVIPPRMRKAILIAITSNRCAVSRPLIHLRLPGKRRGRLAVARR